MLESFKKIIYEICDEEGIQHREFSNGWIIELIQGDTIRHIVAMRFPLNDYATASILNDKYATFCVLKNHNIPIIEHKMFFNPFTRKKYISDFDAESDIVTYLKAQKNSSIIIKANEGFGGKKVYKCISESDVHESLKNIFAFFDSVSVCPFYDIKCEYRLVYLNDECKLIFGKIASKDNWKHNLAQGATVLDVVDSGLITKLKEIANEVVRVLNCKFVSIDIAQLTDGTLLVMEVNASVSILKYSTFSDANMKRTKEIYKQAILAIFNSK